MPLSTNGPSRSTVYSPGTGSRAMSASEAVAGTRPAVSTPLGPKRVTSDWATFDTTAMVNAIALNAEPHLDGRVVEHVLQVQRRRKTPRTRSRRRSW